MKRFIKYTLLTLCAVGILGLSSCAKHGAERPRRYKFQVISLDKVSGSLSEGWSLTLTVANNTASNVRIANTTAFIRDNGRKIGRLVVDEEIIFPRRRTSQIKVPVRITLSNPIAALGFLNKVRKGDFSGITVDYSIEVSTFVSHRTFERENVSLEELAQQFNLGLKK